MITLKIVLQIITITDYDYPRSGEQQRPFAQINRLFMRRIVIFYLSISTQKNGLIETVLLSFHNLCFALEMKKSIF